MDTFTFLPRTENLIRNKRNINNLLQRLTFGHYCLATTKAYLAKSAKLCWRCLQIAYDSLVFLDRVDVNPEQEEKFTISFFTDKKVKVKPDLCEEECGKIRTIDNCMPVTRQ